MRHGKGLPMKTRYLLLTLLTTACLSLPLLAADATDDFSTRTENIPSDLTLLNMGELTDVRFAPDPAMLYDGRAMTLYTTLSEAIAARQTVVDIRALGYTDTAELDALLSQMLNAAPLWNPVSDAVIYRVENGIIASVTLSYPVEWNGTTISTIEEGIAHALSGITDTMSDLEKMLYLHDYLVREVDYDLSDVFPGYVYRPEGVFVHRSAVCQGYAEAYSLLLTRLGYTSRVVSSSAMNHAWNMVLLDGTWYHVDVTWDDPTNGFDGDFCRGGYVRHDYFLKSDAEMRDLEHSGWSSTVTADVSGSYEGYCFRDGEGMMNYKDGYWYYAQSDTIRRAKVDGSDAVDASITLKKQYVFLHDGLLYYTDGVFIYAIDTAFSDPHKVDYAEYGVANLFVKLDTLQYWEWDENNVLYTRTVDLSGAADKLFTIDDVEYGLRSDGTAAVLSYAGTAEDLTIPARANGCPVTAIGAGAFKSNTTLKSVTLSEGIQVIGDNAFQFSNLVQITLPEGLTSIGSHAFYNCNFVARYVFPSTLRKLGASAFAYNQKLRDVFFLGDVPADFGKDAFQTWQDYTPPTLHYAIGTSGWTKPTWTSPDGTVYSTSPFDPAVLTDPHACGDNAFWAYDNGTLTITGSGAMWNYSVDGMPWQEYGTEIQAAVVAEGITHIGSDAFRGMGTLQTVTLPGSPLHWRLRLYADRYLLPEAARISPKHRQLCFLELLGHRKCNPSRLRLLSRRLRVPARLPSEGGIFPRRRSGILRKGCIPGNDRAPLHRGQIGLDNADMDRSGRYGIHHGDLCSRNGGCTGRHQRRRRIRLRGHHQAVCLLHRKSGRGRGSLRLQRRRRIRLLRRDPSVCGLPQDGIKH